MIQEDLLVAISVMNYQSIKYNLNAKTSKKGLFLQFQKNGSIIWKRRTQRTKTPTTFLSR
jgi:hypothetical protein